MFLPACRATRCDDPRPIPGNIEPKCDESVELFKRQRLVLMDEMVHLIRAAKVARTTVPAAEATAA